MDNAKLFLNIKSRDKVFYDDFCDIVSSTNEIGPFDILPFHINFICLIKDSTHVYVGDSKILDMKIGNGILKVEDNRVSIFLDV